VAKTADRVNGRIPLTALADTSAYWTNVELLDRNIPP
jgi:hypothetical protein